MCATFSSSSPFRWCFPFYSVLVGAVLVFEFLLDLRRRRRGSAPTRPHHQCWNVYGTKKSQQTTEKERNPPYDCSSLAFERVVRNPPSNLLTKHKKQQKLKDSDRPTHSQKKGSGTSKTTKSQTFCRNFSLSLTFLLFFFRLRTVLAHPPGLGTTVTCSTTRC